MFKKYYPGILFIFLSPAFAQSQFLDEFSKDRLEGWFFYTGDGYSTMDFVQKEDNARILIDATHDPHNVWWTIIKRDVSSYLDLSKFEDPDYELRIEAKIKASHAPRRVNFMINTQRTTNYHEHLREYDIADTSEWHVISMTTKNLDVVPGDSLFVQFCVTDWGVGKYHVDIDYYRADIVDVNKAGPDLGEPLIYHPPIPDVKTFSQVMNVSHDAIINSDYPDVNFNDWHIMEENSIIPILTVSKNQWPILRWDVDQLGKLKADGAGLLELTTHSVLTGGDFISTYGQDFGEEFGKVRVIEIFGGDPKWKQDFVTYTRLFKEEDNAEIINEQMMYDAEVTAIKGGKTYITISRPVLQRLFDGTTKGLIIKPLGAINASFYASEEPTGEKGPKMYFNTMD